MTHKQLSAQLQMVYMWSDVWFQEEALFVILLVK